MLSALTDLPFVGCHVSKQELHSFFCGLSFIYCNMTNAIVPWQVATNTLERVAPLTHAVGNVLKRVFVIGFSIIVFGKCNYFSFSMK
jgi:hypothetical protein